MKAHLAALVALLLTPLTPMVSLHAQAPLRDPSLPSVPPKALQQLSDNRIRQKIMQQSQARYGSRCVCPYQTKDLHGRSCKGRHEVIKTGPQPICYPRQITSEMVADWRSQFP
jgi:hypothetical protein